MSILSVSATDSSSEALPNSTREDAPQTTRRGRPRRTRSELELVADIQQAQQQLKALRRSARRQAIELLGNLAYKAGLRGRDPERLLQEFKRIAQQGTLVLLLTTAVLLSGCGTSAPAYRLIQPTRTLHVPPISQRPHCDIEQFCV